MTTSSLSYKDLASFVWNYAKRQRFAFLFIATISFVWASDATLWPYIFRFVIDGFTQHETSRDTVWNAIQTPVWCGVALWLFVEYGFRAQGFLMARVFPQLEADVRLALFDYIQRHSPKYFNEHLAGSLSNKISDVTIHLTLALQNMLTMFIPALFTAIIAVWFFLELQPFFAFLLALWIAVHIGICIATAKKCDAYEGAHSKARSTIAGKIVDSLQNNFAVNLFFRFGYELKKIQEFQKEEQEKHVLSRKYVERIRLVLGLTCFIIAGVGINGLMIHYWIKGLLTTGEVAQIFNTTWSIIMMMWMVGMTIPSFFQSLGLLKENLSLLQDPQDIVDKKGAKPLQLTQGEIIFNNVSFYYGDKGLFQNKNVHIKGGQKVGLVGYSGAGKSTFVNLILRFYPVSAGKILIDGQDIQAVTLESLRKQISLIPQDPMLFHRSLKENIAFGKEDASDQEIEESAKKAHAHEFISKLRGDYHAIVGERGAKLSGGERQRIAIARAIIAKSPILILDEATSALDSVTEQYIQDSLEQLMKGKTVIAIAHRLSTLCKMDRILVFDKGKVIEDGTHSELLAQNGHYAHMWNMQVGGFLPSS